MKRKLSLTLLVFAVCLSSSPVLSVGPDCTQAILQTPAFREALTWTGTNAPSEEESCALLNIVTNLSQATWMSDLEQFLSNYPTSPWAASLHHAYASFCRRTGRTTKALDHWQSAWALVQYDTSDSGKAVGGMVLGSWTDLLSSLGRVEEIGQLVPAGDQWPFANHQDLEKFQGAKNSWYLMQFHPEIAFRCGTLALKAVGQALQPTNALLEDLPEVPCPTNGFSLDDLANLAQARGVDLVAVWQGEGLTNLIVPALIHWQQNHYAAIVAQQDNAYLVQDPTFGYPQWLPLEVINAEASGAFLIPTAAQTNGWDTMSTEQAQSIHGQGLPNYIRDGQDRGKKDPCKNAKGAPVFWCSEPWVNLWISDEPISYLTSRGEPFPFRITFKQRDTRPSLIPTNNATVVSKTGWNNNWASSMHLEFDPVRGTNVSTTLFLPDGGEIEFGPTPGIGYFTRYDPETRAALQPVRPDSLLGDSTAQYDYGDFGFRVTWADGSQDIYGFGVKGSAPYADLPYQDYMRTRHIDPHGNTTSFLYESDSSLVRYRVKTVADYDGRTNTLSYHPSSGLLIGVTNPYGASASFQYDAKSNLMQIIDAAGLVSTMAWDTNFYPTNLVTPYGTNRFEYTVAETNAGNGNFGGHSLIDRAIRITEPGGAISIYLYRYDSPFMPTNYPSSDVPTSTPLGTLDDGSGATNNLGSVGFRNSFYWNPRQYAGLSTTTITNLSTNDYLRGRLRHWLQDTNELFLSSLLSIERDPSPDGTTEGLKVFYDYPGKQYRQREGTSALPAVAAWRLPGGETHYQYLRYDESGNVTNAVATYTKSDGSLGTRTNQFVYALNTYTNVYGTVIGIDITSTRTNSFTVRNLLTQAVGPDGNILWTCGGFDTVTWTNNYVGGTQTNRNLLISQRVVPNYLINGANEVIEMGFAGFNKFARVKWPSGLTTSNLYNSSGFLWRSIDLEIGRTNTFAYTNNGLPGVFTNALGLVVNATWDPLLRLTNLAFPDGSYIANVYDRLDVGAARDRLGNWSSFAYDGLRHVTAITNANTNVTRLSWCGCGSLESVANALNQTNTLTHDNQMRLSGIQFPDNSSITYQYDLAGRITNAIDGASRFLKYTYNNQGLLTTVSNAFGRVLSTLWDIRDRPIQITDANGVTVTNAFDNLDRLLSRTWPSGGGSEGFLWSTNGLLAYTNQDQKVTRFVRDAAGRLTAVTNANQERVQIGYNALGEVTNLVDGLNHTNLWHYNEYGWLTNKVDALGREVLRFAYDANGRLTNRWTPELGNTGYAFDAVGNLKTINYPLFTINYLYDAVGQLTNMVDQAGTTKFTWTAAGQLQIEDGPWSNDTLTNGYTQRLRTSLSINSASPTINQTYGYDSAWRLQTLASAAGNFGYGYSVGGAASLVSTIALPNGAWITNHYDSLSRLDYTALLNRWGHVLDGYGYTHDPLGLRTNITRDFGLSNSTVSIGYDNIGQLISWSARETSGPLRLNEQLSYVYDAAGNLRYRTNGYLTQTFTCDAANELTNITRSGTLTVSGNTPAPATNVTVNGSPAERYGDFTFARTNNSLSDGTNTFTIVAQRAGQSVTNILTVNLPATNPLRYDSNGNLTNDGTLALFFSAENQVTNITLANAWKTEFVYDGLGRRRVEKDFAWQGGQWVKTNEARLVCDGLLPVQERDSNNVAVVTYTRGLDLSGSVQGAGGIGGLLARTDAGGPTFYHADGAGNVAALMDAQEDMAARYLSDPFGRVLGRWGPLAEPNVMGFSSMPVHPSGIVHFYGRDYGSLAQRWLSQDPIGERGGINLYGFVRNNPIGRFDPFGLQEPRGNDFVSRAVGGAIRGIIDIAKDLWHLTDPVPPPGDPYDLSKPLDLDPIRDGPIVLGAGGPNEATSFLTAMGLAFGPKLLGPLEKAPCPPRVPRISAKGLARVEAHLDDVLQNQFPEFSRAKQLEFQAGERAMLDRLRLGETSSQEVEFYLHELKESARFRATGDLFESHNAALQWRGLTSYDLFHPDVIRAYAALFPPNWQP